MRVDELPTENMMITAVTVTPVRHHHQHTIRILRLMVQLVQQHTVHQPMLRGATPLGSQQEAQGLTHATDGHRISPTLRKIAIAPTLDPPMEHIQVLQELD